MANKSDDYDKKYMKIKFKSDDDLPLKKTLKLCNMVIVVRSVFHVSVYKSLTLEYYNIDVVKGIDVNKTYGSQELFELFVISGTFLR